MHPDRAPESRELVTGSVHHFWEVADDQQHDESIFVRPPISYRQAFGEKPIRLGLIEFRMLLFLASRPYHAFTRRQIAAALSTEVNALEVDQEAIDGHIATLRDQLGVLADFVQTVPGVGYRYKA